MINKRKKQIQEILENMHKIKKLLAHDAVCYHKNKAITNAQFIVLQIIKDEKNIGIKEIAKILGISCSATTQIINTLVNGYTLAGFISEYFCCPAGWSHYFKLPLI